MSDAIKYSIIVPVCERCDNLITLYEEFAAQLNNITDRWEWIFVFDFSFAKQCVEMKQYKEEKNAPIKIVRFGRDFGESVALTAGMHIACGEYIITHAAYFQVVPEGLRDVISALDGGVDLVITRRFPRQDPFLNRMQSRLFHAIVGKMVDFTFHDMSCGLRAMKRSVLESINLTGDFYRFFPVLAHKYGFRIVEVNLRQRKEDTKLRVRRVSTYVSRVIDIVSIFFLVKFTRKPLRFFGMIGASMLVLGGLLCAYLTFMRLFLSVSLSDRSALLFGLLLVVVGIQTISIGLVGELIIFTHARDIKEYTIEEIS